MDPRRRGGTGPAGGGMGVTVSPGFTETERPALAALYWQAFGGKLGRLLGPGARAETYLVRALRPDHALVARDGAGRVLGVAGFRTRRGTFLPVDRAALAAVYGLPGGAMRAGALALLAADSDGARFLVDGIAVAEPARGQGVGSALLAALLAEARQRGHAAIRLDVVAENPRARALYERMGFTEAGGGQSRVAALLFGHRRWTTMERPV